MWKHKKNLGPESHFIVTQVNLLTFNEHDSLVMVTGDTLHETGVGVGSHFAVMKTRREPRSRQPELRTRNLVATFDITTQLEINRACLHGMSAPDTESEKLVLLHI